MHLRRQQVMEIDAAQWLQERHGSLYTPVPHTQSTYIVTLFLYVQDAQ